MIYKNSSDELISVIVPIYNSESFLNRCIDSIIVQSYKNLEIILVDDGSTDQSGAICDAYAQKDCRCKVIHKKNGGAGSARNRGLSAATGEFIGFVDSDDSIEPDMYEVLIKSMKKNVDIVTCGRYVYRAGSDTVRRKAYCLKSEQLFSNNCAIGELLRGEVFAYGVNEKIYRRELFENVVFPNSLVAEDIPVTYELFKKSSNIVHTGTIKYNNFCRLTSVSNPSNYNKRIAAIRFRRDIWLDIKREFPEYKKLAEASYIREVVRLLDSIKKSENRDKYNKLEKECILFLNKMKYRILLNDVFRKEEKAFIIQLQKEQ